MNLYTEGRSEHKEYIFNLFHHSGDNLLVSKGEGILFKIVFIKSGTGVAEIGGENFSKKYSFIAPCAFCINEKENIKIFDDSAEYSYIFFHPEVINSGFNFDNIRDSQSIFSHSEVQDLYWLDPFLNRDEKSGGYITYGPSTALRMDELCESIGKELDSQVDRFWPCRSRSFLFELLNLLMKIFSSSVKLEYAAMSSIDPDMDNIILYLNSNYHKKITISSITNMFNIDRTTLAEKIKKITGLSLISYLNKIRIHMACSLLRDTSLPVVEIMYRVGYEDKTHFGRLFKKYSGTTPSLYRKNI